MFRRFFSLMTLTVIFSLTAASFSLMFSFLRFWKTDHFKGLADDALSFARSVTQLYDEDKEIFPINEENDSAFLLSSSFLTVSGRSAGELYIVDEDGQIILCKEMIALNGETLSLSPPDAYRTFTIPPEKIVEARANFPEPLKEETDALPGHPDETFFVLAPLIPDGQYFVVLLQDVQSSYVPYTSDLFRMVLGTAFWAIALAFVLALINSHRLVKPLKNITEATKQFASGNFDARIKPGDTYSELRELIESFNSMADSLQSIDESRSRFVADTSHELKTPMTIISGFVDGILDGTIPPEDTEKYLRIVSDETKRLSRLVVSMLNISKIEADKLKLTLTDVALDDMLCKTVVGFEKTIGDKNISVFGLDELEPVTVPADDTLLGQILYNLIDNAVKFTPDYGEIRVSLTQDKKTAVLKIRNSGKGIPPEECPHIFDRFYKVDKSRGLDAKSFGIGLFIVKSVIELHRGTISVDSVVDEYTEFTVCLPTERQF
ncbi:MAG: HAMP domain-containing histidine kinase [Clostridia bacterium]|nr:HAMP domain-containing histidine kinase [Clostridia bacterium]